MIEGLIIGTLIYAVAIGGKAILTGMMSLPLIGGFAGWYTGLVGPLPNGLVSNVIYGAMAAQVIILPLSVVIYGPGLVRRLAAKRRRQKPVIHTIISATDQLRAVYGNDSKADADAMVANATIVIVKPLR